MQRPAEGMFHQQRNPLASVKNLSKAIIKEPESPGAEIKRKDSTDKDAGQAPVAPRTSGGVIDQ
ncbi:hypothetical protein JQK88_16415 [Mesorhizobium caraganae]|uniref:hypothetical protein n=1 Tax=Mesorhizobium caraganae TaxID=483206 RepID=UPI00193A090B|nr:hypothetical protein [Mesorhizobium caraganae]MBM2712796.1 hypothetical protein [Mesorhizobium caraganae]